MLEDLVSEIQPGVTVQPDARLWAALSSSVCKQLLLPGDKGAFCSGLTYTQVSVSQGDLILNLAFLCLSLDPFPCRI